MRRTAMLALAALAAASSANTAPASARSRLYPWCADKGNGATNCYFSTLDQCRAVVSGSGGQCVANSWYAAYGPYYSFGGGGSRR